MSRVKGGAAADGLAAWATAIPQETREVRGLPVFHLTPRDFRGAFDANASEIFVRAGGRSIRFRVRGLQNQHPG